MHTGTAHFTAGGLTKSVDREVSRGHGALALRTTLARLHRPLSHPPRTASRCRGATRAAAGDEVKLPDHSDGAKLRGGTTTKADRTEPAAAQYSQRSMTSQLTSLSEQHVTRHARHTIPPRPLGRARSPCPCATLQAWPRGDSMPGGRSYARATATRGNSPAVGVSTRRRPIDNPRDSPHATACAPTSSRELSRPTTELASLRAGCSRHDADNSSSRVRRFRD